MATAESVRVSELVLRPCTVVDAEAVERLRVSGWKAAYRGLVPDSFLDSMLADVERRRQLMASQGGQVTESVAVSGADVVGWIVAGSCRDAALVPPGGQTPAARSRRARPRSPLPATLDIVKRHVPAHYRSVTSFPRAAIEDVHPQRGRELCALARVKMSGTREPSRSSDDEFPRAVVSSPLTGGSGFV